MYLAFPGNSIIYEVFMDSRVAVVTRIASVDATGVQALGALTAGTHLELGVTVNEVPLEPEVVTTATWEFQANNVLVLSTILYTASFGSFAPAQLSSYPLRCVMVPAIVQAQALQGVALCEGTTVLPELPVFNADSPFFLVMAGLSTWEKVDYGTPAVLPSDHPDFALMIALADAAQKEDVGCRLDFTMMVAPGVPQGRAFVIQLVKSNLQTVAADGKTIIDAFSTNGEFWFDGSDYPYVAEKVTGLGNVLVRFVDFPSYYTNIEEDGAVVSGSAEFITYFFFQPASDGSAPYLIGQPVGWSYSYEYKFSGGKLIEVSPPVAVPPEPAGTTQLPKWKRNVPAGTISRSHRPRSKGG
jgi:hypothetical protein